MNTGLCWQITEHLVVDEAHKLPEAASQMDGRSIGREDVQEISYFLNREHKSSEGKTTTGLV